MTTLEAAKKYALDYGWLVMPTHFITLTKRCSCGAVDDYLGTHKHAMGKHPYPEHGHKDASKDVAQIDSWWELYPNANLSIATGLKSNLIVLDIDKKNDGYRSLEQLERRYGKIPLTPKVISGGGGLHFYFKHPGFEVRGRRGMFPGIDVQADGGRIVAPPSNHKSGKNYEWDKKAHSEIPRAAIPHWLLRLIIHYRKK